MQSKKIRINLNTDSIDNAIKQINEYKNELSIKTETLVSRLADEGFKIVKQNLSGINYTGELQSSVNITKKEIFARISVDSEHAIYVEFGTGVKGKSSPYIGNNDIGYKYAVGENIGWYNINGEMKYGWFYFDILEGTTAFTEGMPSRPFMYNSAQELRLIKINKIVKEVFG